MSAQTEPAAGIQNQFHVEKSFSSMSRTRLGLVPRSNWFSSTVDGLEERRGKGEAIQRLAMDLDSRKTERMSKLLGVFSIINWAVLCFVVVLLAPGYAFVGNSVSLAQSSTAARYYRLQQQHRQLQYASPRRATSSMVRPSMHLPGAMFVVSLVGPEWVGAEK